MVLAVLGDGKPTSRAPHSGIPAVALPERDARAAPLEPSGSPASGTGQGQFSPDPCASSPAAAGRPSCGLLCSPAISLDWQVSASIRGASDGSTSGARQAVWPVRVFDQPIWRRSSAILSFVMALGSAWTARHHFRSLLDGPTPTELSNSILAPSTNAPSPNTGTGITTFDLASDAPWLTRGTVRSSIDGHSGSNA